MVGINYALSLLINSLVALDKTLDDDTKRQDEKMDRYTVKNNDTGEIYDIRKIDPQMETYSMFPNDFISLMNNPSDSNKQTKSRPPLKIGLKFGKRGKTRELKRNHVAVRSCNNINTC